MDFDKAFRAVIGIEGVYSSDPDDTGNWTGGKKGVGELKGTKYGISAASYPDLDIKNLSLVNAKAIYLADFWSALRCDELPDMMKLPVFDMGVNQGRAAAAKTLQRAARVNDDGVIGPLTIKAVWASEVMTWQRFMSKRAVRYTTAATFWKHGDGWMNRLFSVAYDSLRRT
jgi:lysozyme family protein